MPATKKITTKRKRRAPATWRETFLAALSETSNVSGAARKAKVDKASVYKARRNEAEFNRRWQAALAEGYDNLEFDLLHRLRIGQLDGGKAQARRKYDNAGALRLLSAHREAVGRQRAVRADEDEEAIIRSINAKIEQMKRRDEEAKRLLAPGAAEDTAEVENRAENSGDAR